MRLERRATGMAVIAQPVAVNWAAGDKPEPPDAAEIVRFGEANRAKLQTGALSQAMADADGQNPRVSTAGQIVARQVPVVGGERCRPSALSVSAGLCGHSADHPSIGHIVYVARQQGRR